MGPPSRGMWVTLGRMGFPESRAAVHSFIPHPYRTPEKIVVTLMGNSGLYGVEHSIKG